VQKFQGHNAGYESGILTEIEMPKLLSA